MKRYINAALYWLFPQSGMIACLEKKVKMQDDLIQTIRANRQTIINENQKLEAALHMATAERDEALHRVSVYEAKADAIRQAAQGTCKENLQVAAQAVEVCEWMPRTASTWDTFCGVRHNRASSKFCPYCGKPIKIKGE